MNKPLGVSVVICTYNGAARLPETLARLAAQRVEAAIPWEVLVVDNASTDETAEVAARWAAEFEAAPFRVVREPRPGLSHARQCGLREARHEIVSFIDDDNRVCADWVRIVSEIMTAHPEVGACGGRCEAALDEPPPAWFADYHGSFVIGAQGAAEGDVTEERGWLWGAGLSLRKAAWEALRARGFEPMLADRTGSKLSSCGDIEICYALRLAGLRLWYSPALRIDHYLPGRRLRWEHVLEMYEGVGLATVSLDAYERVLRPAPRPASLRTRLRDRWPYQALGAGKQLLENVLRRFFSSPDTAAHRRAACSVRFFSARLGALLTLRAGYEERLRAMASAPWLTR